MKLVRISSEHLPARRRSAIRRDRRNADKAHFCTRISVINSASGRRTSNLPTGYLIADDDAALSVALAAIFPLFGSLLRISRNMRAISYVAGLRLQESL